MGWSDSLETQAGASKSTWWIKFTEAANCDTSPLSWSVPSHVRKIYLRVKHHWCVCVCLCVVSARSCSRTIRGSGGEETGWICEYVPCGSGWAPERKGKRGWRASSSSTISSTSILSAIYCTMACTVLHHSIPCIRDGCIVRKRPRTLQFTTRGFPSNIYADIAASKL